MHWQRILQNRAQFNLNGLTIIEIEVYYVGSRENAPY